MKQVSQNDSIEQPSALKEQVRNAAIAMARLTGWAALDRAALVAEFKGRAGRSTLYRWLSEIDGAPLDRTVGEMIQDARAGCRAGVESVAGEVKARALVPIPMAPSIGDCFAAVTPAHIIENLHRLLSASTDVMARSRDSAGAVRNGKMLLQAAEQMRRSLETAVKLQEAISDGLRVEAFHRTLLDEVAKLDPAAAARIVARLSDVNDSWAVRDHDKFEGVGL
jgi:hypothetical protein